jgi:DNA polymerase V
MTSLVAGSVCAGFPSPAADYTDVPLDLNTHLVKHPAATFFVRCAGDSMINAGIYTGDTLIVDRSVRPVDGSVIIANLAGDFTVKRLKLQGSHALLVPENPKYKPINTQAFGDDFIVWGVVTYVIHDPNKQ